MQDEFDQVIKTAGDRLVVVDFYATWCGPCKMIAPKLDVCEHFTSFKNLFCRKWPKNSKIASL